MDEVWSLADDKYSNHDDDVEGESPVILLLFLVGQLSMPQLSFSQFSDQQNVQNQEYCKWNQVHKHPS